MWYVRDHSVCQAVWLIDVMLSNWWEKKVKWGGLCDWMLVTTWRIAGHCGIKLRHSFLLKTEQIHKQNGFIHKKDLTPGEKK